MEVDVGEEIDVDKIKTEISRLQNIIKGDPYTYDSRVELISLLKKLHSIYKAAKTDNKLDSEQRKVTEDHAVVAFKKLRNARQSMSAIYPLTSELWLSWIEDEVDACPSVLNQDVIEDIFSKATVDYISADVWCKQVCYLIKQLDNGECTVDSIRDVLEKGVLSCGLDYREGHKIWKCYEDIELRVLLEKETRLNEDDNKTNVELYKQQFLKLVKVFKRELSLPLQDHEHIFNRYGTSVERHLQPLKLLLPEEDLSYITNEINTIHTKTLETIESIASNEYDLDVREHSLEAYESYIMHELESLSDPARIQCLFERAIVRHCLMPSLWLDYIDFLNNVIKIPDLAISVSKRALRNITWDCRIHNKYVTILQESSYATSDIRQAYEEGLQKYSNNGFNYCSVFISCLSFEKRLCKNESVVISKLKPRVYSLLQQALRQFQEIEGADKSIVEFVLFWVDIERFWFKDEEKAKDIWKYMLSQYECVWEHAVTFARTIGNKELVNDIFHIALLQYPDKIDIFSQSIYNYETMCGTVDSLSYVMKKVNLCKNSGIRIKKTKELQHMLSKIEHQNKFIKSWIRNAKDSLFRISIAKEKTPVKKSRDSIYLQVNPRKGVGKMYVDIEDVKQDQGHKRKHEEEMEVTDNAVIGPVLPPGFLPGKNDSENDSDSESTTDDDDEEKQSDVPPIKKQKVDDLESDKSKTETNFEVYSTNTTVFVSNLHPATKSTDLKTIFSRAGEVEKVDLRKRGAKIFAFITYKTNEEAQKAFELEHTPLYNRPLFVSEFKEPSADKTANTTTPASQYSQNEEKNKLFVSNLSKFTTQLDLEKLFNQYGDMSSLRLINKKGSTRTFAFVEYATVEAASRYRKAINGTEVRGQSIVVEFSNPSAVQTPKPNFERGYTNSSEGKPSKSEPTATDSGSVIKNEDKVFVKPKPFLQGLVPFQARNPVKPPQLLSKQAPSYRLSVVPPGKPTDTTSQQGSEADTSENKPSSSDAVSSARKSNEEFRKMFFKK